MPTLTIRNLDDRLKQRLRLRAAQHGWSMEQEAPVILAEVLDSPAQNDGAAWLQRVRQRFQGVVDNDSQPSDRREGTERELTHFAGRLWAFDAAAAQGYAQVKAQRHRAGRPIGHADVQIAALALIHEATLVTRNLTDFAGIEGLGVLNPWASSCA